MQPHQLLFRQFFDEKLVIGVSSSNVSWIQYDQDFPRLVIGYLNGKAYAYSGVSPQEAAALLFAPSKGEWVWSNIRVRGKGNAKKTRKPFAQL
jgi:hypothetical protein